VEQRRRPARNKPGIDPKALLLGLIPAGFLMMVVMQSLAPRSTSNPPLPGAGEAMDLTPYDDGSHSGSLAPPGFPVMGNISMSSGERLYHLPGMRDYDITAIDPAKGERWFRTEQEAIANGWKKAVSRE
jgi:hypothetical protein